MCNFKGKLQEYLHKNENDYQDVPQYITKESNIEKYGSGSVYYQSIVSLNFKDEPYKFYTEKYYSSKKKAEQAVANIALNEIMKMDEEEEKEEKKEKKEKKEENKQWLNKKSEIEIKINNNKINCDNKNVSNVNIETINNKNQMIIIEPDPSTIFHVLIDYENYCDAKKINYYKCRHPEISFKKYTSSFHPKAKEADVVVRSSRPDATDIKICCDIGEIYCRHRLKTPDIQMVVIVITKDRFASCLTDIYKKCYHVPDMDECMNIVKLYGS